MILNNYMLNDIRWISGFIPATMEIHNEDFKKSAQHHHDHDDDTVVWQ